MPYLKKSNLRPTNQKQPTILWLYNEELSSSSDQMKQLYKCNESDIFIALHPCLFYKNLHLALPQHNQWNTSSVELPNSWITASSNKLLKILLYLSIPFNMFLFKHFNICQFKIFINVKNISLPIHERTSIF